MTDCENFYNVLLAFLVHPDETENVNSLLTWWNKYVVGLNSWCLD